MILHFQRKLEMGQVVLVQDRLILTALLSQKIDEGSPRSQVKQVDHR